MLGRLQLSSSSVDPPDKLQRDPPPKGGGPPAQQLVRAVSVVVTKLLRSLIGCLVSFLKIV